MQFDIANALADNHVRPWTKIRNAIAIGDKRRTPLRDTRARGAVWLRFSYIIRRASYRAQLQRTHTDWPDISIPPYRGDAHHPLTEKRSDMAYAHLPFLSPRHLSSHPAGNLISYRQRRDRRRPTLLTYRHWNPITCSTAVLVRTKSNTVREERGYDVHRVHVIFFLSSSFFLERTDRCDFKPENSFSRRHRGCSRWIYGEGRMRFRRELGARVRPVVISPFGEPAGGGRGRARASAGIRILLRTCARVWF